MTILSLNVISVIAGRCHGEKVNGMIFMGWNGGGGGGGAPGAFKRQLPRWGDTEPLVMCEDCKGDGELLGKCGRDRRDLMVGGGEFDG